MKSLFSVLSALLLFACAAHKVQLVGEYTSAEKENRLQRAQQFGEHYVNRMNLFIEENPSEITGGFVFVGDSITERFPVEVAFPEQNVINRGIGGDSVKGVAERLDTSVRDLEPSRVYLMIGINDILWSDASVEDLANQYSELIEKLKSAAPDAEVTVFTTLPVTGKWAHGNKQVYELNEELHSIAAEQRVEIIDLLEAMSDEDGALRAEYTTDGVHLSLAGYLAWLEQFVHGDKEYLQTIRALADEWREAYPVAFPITAIDPPKDGEFPGSRGRDQLIVYTPAYGHASTGTNEWGVEATVVDYVIKSVASTGDSPIPANGYVVSGHGSAAVWIGGNLLPGTEVQLTADGIEPVRTREETNKWIGFWQKVATIDAAGQFATQRDALLKELAVLRR